MRRGNAVINSHPLTNLTLALRARYAAYYLGNSYSKLRYITGNNTNVDHIESNLMLVVVPVGIAYDMSSIAYDMSSIAAHHTNATVFSATNANLPKAPP